MAMRFIAVLLLGGSLALWGASSQTGSGAKTAAKPAHASDSTNKGESLFRAHCGRCHAPPQELSPRVARTVLQHMRVRAMLSKEDQQEILNYIAPN